MDLDAEVKNACLDTWLKDCITSSDQEVENFLGESVQPHMEEISEKDVNKEIEELVSQDDELLNSSSTSPLPLPSKIIMSSPDIKESQSGNSDQLSKVLHINKMNTSNNGVESTEKVISNGSSDRNDDEEISDDIDSEKSEANEDESSDENEEGASDDDDDQEEEDGGESSESSENQLEDKSENVDSGEGEEEQDEGEEEQDEEHGEIHEENDDKSREGNENIKMEVNETENEDNLNELESNDHDSDGEVEVGEHFIESDHEMLDVIGDSDTPMNNEEDDSAFAATSNNSAQFADNPEAILEPSCEIAEASEDDHIFKARFNLRKRSLNNSNDDTESLASENENDEEQTEGPIKKLKFIFPKKNFRRQRPYTNEAVKEAIKMVQSKRMSILEASRQFDIPRTSLHNFLRLYRRGKKVGVSPISPGLTKQEENEIVSLVIKLSRCGKRYSHNELRFLIQYYLVNNDRSVFKSGTLPTMGWIAGLVERQPELTKAKSKKNTKVDIDDVEEWQKQIEDYLINDWDLDIEDIFQLENGHRIFCFTAFKMTVNGPSENAENKPTNPIKKEPGVEDEKDPELSVILGMSADGTFEIPLVVFSEDHQGTHIETDPDELRIAFNKTARVEDDVALQMIKDFDEEVNQRGIPKPIVLFVNDKQDMAHFSVIEYCWENQIVIICLPPRTSKTMTPFEVSIWPRVRSCYSTLWKNANKSLDNKLSVEQFPDLFVQAWRSACIPKQGIRGFIKSGLIPLNVPAILTEPSSISNEPLDENQLYHKRMISSIREEPVKTELSALEERSRGKLEGIQMCLEAIESFIPPDIKSVWNNRGADYRGRCELSFKLWKSVSLLLKAGCAMASIQQMADGVCNPFDTDFASSPSFFQSSKPPPQLHTLPSSLPESNTQNSTVICRSAEGSSSSAREKFVPKKRKLNKSIYSISDTSPSKLNGVSESSVNNDLPFVRIHQNPFLPHSLMDTDG